MIVAPQQTVMRFESGAIINIIQVQLVALTFFFHIILLWKANQEGVLSPKAST